MSGRSHPKCWNEEAQTYFHEECREPTGLKCIVPGCLNAAGTGWGPHYCPEHDVERLDRISRNLEGIAGRLSQGVVS